MTLTQVTGIVVTGTYTSTWQVLNTCNFQTRSNKEELHQQKQNKEEENQPVRASDVLEGLHTSTGERARSSS